MIIKSKDLLKNPGMRSSVMNWVQQVAAGKSVVNSKLMGSSLQLDPTTAARLGIDFSYLLRRMGLSPTATTLQQEFNLQNSRSKSELFAICLMIMRNDAFFQELFLLKEIEMQRLKEAFDEFGNSTDYDRLNLATAVRLRLEEEMLVIEAENQARQVVPTLSESTFVQRLQADMAKKEVWLAECEQANNEWGDRIFSPVDSAENRAFRQKFDAQIARTNELRRENAENLSRLRLDAEDALAAAKTPEQKKRVSGILDEIKVLETEERERALRVQPKNLEDKVFVHLPQMKEYIENKQDNEIKKEYDAMTDAEKAKFIKSNPNFLKEYEARMNDPSKQKAVQDEGLRGANVNLLHEELIMRAKLQKNRELREELTTINQDKPSAKVTSIQNNIWHQRHQEVLTSDNKKSETKLISEVFHILNVADEKSRKAGDVDSPGFAENLLAMHNANNEENSNTEVLQQFKKHLSAMQNDETIPATLRAAANTCAVKISANEALTPISNVANTSNISDKNERREAIEKLEPKSKSESVAEVKNMGEFSLSEETREILDTTEIRFDKLQEDDTISPEVLNQLSKLQQATSNLCQNPTTSNAANLKTCFHQVDWESLKENYTAMRLKTVFETDDFIDMLPTATVENQDLDATTTMTPRSF